MAFFRNPLDRLLSTIKHIRTIDKKNEIHDVNKILDMNWNRIMNAQCYAMGYNIKKRNIKVVRRNIMNLNFIGITEYFDASLQLCNATFDWQLENIEPRNAINQEIFSELSSSSKIKISQGIGPELQTYNIAMRHFRKRCKANNIILPI